MLKSMHLFAGAGGGLLADLILGHRPIIAVEHNPYRCEILREREQDEWWPGLRVWEGDIRLFDPSDYAGCVDIIHAGFPCQDISVAGSGAGIDGERSGLYAEVIRIAGVVRPRYVFIENSPAITTRGLYRVVSDFIGLGYVGRHGVVAASDVGAPHGRARWWCIAENTDTTEVGLQKKRTAEQAAGLAGICEEVSDSYRNIGERKQQECANTERREKQNKRPF